MEANTIMAITTRAASQGGSWFANCCVGKLATNEPRVLKGCWVIPYIGQNVPEGQNKI